MKKNIYFTFLVSLSLILMTFLHCSGKIGKILPGKNSPEKVVNSLPPDSKIKLGVDVFIEKYLYSVAGKRVGLLTNQSGVNRDMVQTIEVLYNNPAVNLTTLFGPEHGIRGDVEAGKSVKSYTDDLTKLPVYSLYGETRKITPAMLNNVDVIIFDIQDVGVRPYTYIYSMAYAMEAAMENGKEFIVFDRPNPLGGKLVDGNILDPQFKSFIGLYPIPYVHGLTVGELAWLFNTEFGIGANLKVIPMEGWNRSMTFEDTGLDWISTSPHIPQAETVPYYATTGLIGELGTISVGVGYTLPFMMVGEPDIDPYKLSNDLNSRLIPGVKFRPVFWKQYYGIFSGRQVKGVQINISDMSVYMPYETCLNILEAFNNLFPSKEFFRDDKSSGFYRASGTDDIFKRLKAGVPAEVIINSYKQKLEAFKIMRSRYLLY